MALVETRGITSASFDKLRMRVLARGGAHGGEDGGGREPLVGEPRRALAPHPPALPRPALLPDPGLVLEPERDALAWMSLGSCSHGSGEPLLANASAALASRWG